ncbi:hypothetical protein BC941DRAFT_429957 [Chlamydoabsidia padenii]|nr:hypothetical protein BC941DRAFT_429957 [Chlamydoabsidia padenii]
MTKVNTQQEVNTTTTTTTNEPKSDKDYDKDTNHNTTVDTTCTTSPRTDHNKTTSTDTSITDSTTNDKSSLLPDDTLDLAEQYKDLQHYTDSSNHHPIPSLPPMPHHAPPEDSSELLSPWWSEEPPDVTDSELEDSSNSNSNHHHHQQQQHSNKSDINEEDLSHYLVKFHRQATDKKTGKDLWQEDCYLWTKEPQQQVESNLINDIKTAGIESSSLPSFQHDTAKATKSSSSSSTKKSYPLNSQCAMVCLFRESQERKTKKRQDMNLSSSWNPFYGNWVVVALSRTGFTEHLHETDITQRNSPDYYTVELGERLGRTGEDVTHFISKTLTPVQELGRRYIESWKDGTQVGFFTRFLSSAKRGDAFYLLRDSARRMMENMVANDDKKKDDDDHKR